MAGVHHLSSILPWRISSSFSACNTTLPSRNQTLLYGTGKDALIQWISNMVQLYMGGGDEKWTTAIVTYWIDKGFRDFSNGNRDWSLDGVGKFMDGTIFFLIHSKSDLRICDM
ncbi:Ankyrin repeat protein [Actinidia chinensis var. chinensis]|uniref:Ankyrin repeat protein n=1 Tax=Actinidia chinensis var. chinensis TaxID=1590841 RepID=A0A2R6RZ46_ACTCC|nr:Ankyrin repeat protein [Actinidia chinensis var. chinensis]